MTDKQMEEKREEFITMFPGIYEGLGTGSYLEIHDKVWQWISKLVEEVEVGAIENFIKILIENTEVIGDESIRLVYLKGITRKRLKELLEPTN